MFDLESIERRHAAGSPAKEDLSDLIAEVKRLQGGKPKDEEVEVGFTAADIRKMHRAELDALAAEYGIDLQGANVGESQEVLVKELCEE